MNTTFSKQLMWQAPANGLMAIYLKRCFRRFGVVVTKS